MCVVSYQKLSTSGVANGPNFFVMKTSILLALPIGKRLCICAGFRLGDNIFAHSMANVEMVNVHIMKIFTWM
jgi:hypothetical protein